MGFGQINPPSEEGTFAVCLLKVTCVLPYALCQAETYQGEVTNDTHGTEGPIKVSIAKEYTNIVRSFLDVSAAYDKERSLTDDINAFRSSDQYGVCTLLCRGLPIAQRFTAEMGKVLMDNTTFPISY